MADAKVKLVLEGQKAFIGGMKEATKAVEGFDKSVEAGAQNTGGFSSFFGNLSGVVSKASEGIKKNFGGIIDSFKKLDEGGLGNFNDAISKNIKMLDSWTNALAAIPPPVLAATVAIAGIVAGIGAFIALGLRGAPLQGIVESFAGLAQQAQTTSDALLRSMRSAAEGTISDIQLMTAANVALRGSSADLAAAFGEGLPNLLRIARASARATGEDVVTAFNDIVVGIKRGSAPILDNVGIIIDSAKAYEDYANRIGVAVAALDDEQKKVAILQATIAAGEANTEAFGNVQETAAEKISRLNATITNILDKLSLSVQPLFEAVLDVVNFIATGIQSAIDFIAPAIQFVMELLGALVRGFLFVAQGIDKFLAEPIRNAFGSLLSFIAGFIRNMLVAGARLMGELANGIYAGLNQFVMPAVIAVATAIADFLVGQSPPPKGPLNAITAGGANVMKAWTDGFASATLEPIASVANFVDTKLGDIGKLSLKQVDKRLAGLDKALAPFENKLKIVKATFDSISEPAQAALRAIDRQIKGSLDALAAGDANAQNIVRRLTAQEQFFNKGLAAQQEALDNAEIQLALAKSQQVQERTLLEIRKSQLPAVQQATAATKQLAKATSSVSTGAEPKKTGGGASTAGLTDALAAEAPAAAEAVATPFEQLLGDLGTAFAEPLFDPTTGALAEFNANRGLLDEQLGRLQGANFGDRIGGFFSGVGQGLTDNFVTPFKNKINEVLAFFTDNGQDTSLATSLINLPTRLAEWLATWASGIDLNFTAPFTTAVTNILFGLTSLENPESLAAKLIALPASIPTWFAELSSNLISSLEAPFSTSVQNVIFFLTDVANPLGLAGKMKTFFTGGSETEGTLAYMLLQAYNAFEDFATNQIPRALQNFGLSAWNAIAVPLINVLNWVIDRINEFLSSINTGLAGIAEFLSSVGVQTQLAVGTITFHLDTAPPDWLNGAAKGGIAKGLFKVGERGEELMFSPSEVAVLPNSMTRAFESAMSAMAQPQPLIIPAPLVANAGNSSSSTDNSISATFNGQQDDRYILQRLAMLRAAKF